jgi:hypothetical protein
MMAPYTAAQSGGMADFIFRSLSLVEDEATAMERPRVLLTVSQADKLTIRNTEKTHRLLQLWR